MKPLTDEQKEAVVTAVLRGASTHFTVLASAIRDLRILCHHCEVSVEGFEQMELDMMLSAIERLEIVESELKPGNSQ